MEKKNSIDFIQRLQQVNSFADLRDLCEILPEVKSGLESGQIKPRVAVLLYNQILKRFSDYVGLEIDETELKITKIKKK
ncbi:MAG: hypothetical protein WCW14_04465 [Candidatus Paceibacterota bacterium]|jgi:hypothetical protein